MTTLADYASDNPEIQEILRAGYSHTEAAELINNWYDSPITTESSVRRWRKTNGWKSCPPVPNELNQNLQEPEIFTGEEAVAERSPDEVIAELRASNQRLYKQKMAALEKRDELIDAVYRGAYDAFTLSPKHLVPAPKRDTRPKSDQVALWHTTDWQMAKVTESYDSDVCRARVGRYIDMCEQLTEVERADHPVRHGVVLMTGDMLEGVNIFPGQAFELDANLFEQIFQTAELQEQVVSRALQVYESVDVVCEWGNHGRIGRKSDGFKPSDNIDRIIYEIVKRRFVNEPRIGKFQVSEKFYQHFTIGNYSAIAIHGDEIKSFGGNTPSYGILRKSNAWASGVVEPFQDVYMGHYHQNMVLSMANGGSVYMTGAVESDNEFAREFVAACQKPSQRLNFIHPELGIVTSDRRIWLN